ncbi:hypothetical protein K493DRAFT_310564 [Basidiobolus meristosporus CBS 931.73]|uniref:Uncharacterized protein n=1 Tax=Basidiobolus meristosporus CBS 931.73 TaxID=1314790 RepID=A0A1Y1Z848_9FUNG|nr:hypothetical protein K493DRAFT_310564 [Basidiobolus meristosporus CBS 931.73]|eukprot:ORY06432.1 hypothetical protein K493DRAFT_310564 [Basidiobolus meristosporus CBS 931.73]
MSPCSDFQLYRANLESLSTPCVPYLRRLNFLDIDITHAIYSVPSTDTYLNDCETSAISVEQLILEVERHQGNYDFSVSADLLQSIIQGLHDHGALSAIIKIVKQMEEKNESHTSFPDEEYRFSLRLIQHSHI